MDLKTILVISAIAVGIILVFKDQLLSLLSSSKAALETKPIGTINVGTTVAHSLSDLESLVRALDPDKDKEELDYLIDKLAPKLIRRKLGR